MSHLKVFLQKCLRGVFERKLSKVYTLGSFMQKFVNNGRQQPLFTKNRCEPLQSVLLQNRDGFILQKSLSKAKKFRKQTYHAGKFLEVLSNKFSFWSLSKQNFPVWHGPQCHSWDLELTKYITFFWDTVIIIVIITEKSFLCLLQECAMCAHITSDHVKCWPWQYYQMNCFLQIHHEDRVQHCEWHLCDHSDYEQLTSTTVRNNIKQMTSFLTIDYIC